MKLKILFFLTCISFLFSDNSQTFKLQDGTKITGIIISENDSMFEVDTKLGIIQIFKKDIKKQQYRVFLNDGNVLVGNKISSSDKKIILDTDMGVFKINKEDYFLCIPSIKNDIFFIMMFVIAIIK